MKFLLNVAALNFLSTTLASKPGNPDDSRRNTGHGPHEVMDEIIIGEDSSDESDDLQDVTLEQERERTRAPKIPIQKQPDGNTWTDIILDALNLRKGSEILDLKAKENEMFEAFEKKLPSDYKGFFKIVEPEMPWRLKKVLLIAYSALVNKEHMQMFLKKKWNDPFHLIDGTMVYDTATFDEKDVKFLHKFNPILEDNDLNKIRASKFGFNLKRMEAREMSEYLTEGRKTIEKLDLIPFFENLSNMDSIEVFPWVARAFISTFKTLYPKEIKVSNLGRKNKKGIEAPIINGLDIRKMVDVFNIMPSIKSTFPDINISVLQENDSDRALTPEEKAKIEEGLAEADQKNADGSMPDIVQLENEKKLKEVLEDSDDDYDGKEIKSTLSEKLLDQLHQLEADANNFGNVERLNIDIHTQADEDEAKIGDDESVTLIKVDHYDTLYQESSVLKRLRGEKIELSEEIKNMKFIEQTDDEKLAKAYIEMNQHRLQVIDEQISSLETNHKQMVKYKTSLLKLAANGKKHFVFNNQRKSPWLEIEESSLKKKIEDETKWLERKADTLERDREMVKRDRSFNNEFFWKNQNEAWDVLQQLMEERWLQQQVTWLLQQLQYLQLTMRRFPEKKQKLEKTYQDLAQNEIWINHQAVHIKADRKFRKKFREGRHGSSEEEKKQQDEQMAARKRQIAYLLRLIEMGDSGVPMKKNLNFIKNPELAHLKEKEADVENLIDRARVLLGFPVDDVSPKRIVDRTRVMNKYFTTHRIHMNAWLDNRVIEIIGDENTLHRMGQERAKDIVAEKELRENWFERRKHWIHNQIQEEEAWLADQEAWIIAQDKEHPARPGLDTLDSSDSVAALKDDSENKKKKETKDIVS